MQTDVSKWNFGQMGSFLGGTFWIRTKIVTKLYQEEVNQLIYNLKKKCTILMITFLVLLLRLFAVVLVTLLPGSCE